MNRLKGGVLVGALGLAFGLGAMGCQESSAPSSSAEKSKAAGQKMGEGMKNVQKQNEQKKAAAGAPGGAGDDEDKPKEKAKDKE